MIKKNKLALLYLGVFDFYIYDKYEFVYFLLQENTIQYRVARNS